MGQNKTAFFAFIAEKCVGILKAVKSLNDVLKEVEIHHGNDGV